MSTESLILAALSWSDDPRSSFNRAALHHAVKRYRRDLNAQVLPPGDYDTVRLTEDTVQIIAGPYTGRIIKS